MAWCPKCKNEYIDGITRCSDCDVELVEELEAEKDIEYIYLNVPELIDDVIAYLHQASIDSAEKFHNDEEDIDGISVDKKQYSDARLHISVYLKNESILSSVEESDDVNADDIAENIDEAYDNTEKNTEDSHESTAADDDNSDVSDASQKSVFTPVSTYTKLSDKYEDVKSSAYTLLLVGCVGFIAILLEGFGVFNIPFSPSTKWLFYTVMGGIFIAFIISGTISFIHTKQLKIDAENEDKLIDDILSWFRDNYTKESIDSSIDTDIQDELLYFNRAEYIKNEIMHQFESADEALVDSLIETIYQENFE